MAESATFALKAGVWFRRGRLLIVSPDSRGTACPLSGRNSTYRPVQISAAGSVLRTTQCATQFGGALSCSVVITPHWKLNMNREISELLKAALECSVFINPTDPGLSYQ